MMKRIISLWLLSAVCLVNISARANGRMTIISGQVNREYVVSVILYSVVDGKKSEYASSRLDANGGFAFALPSVKEGFYYIGDQRKNSFIRIYLTAGENLVLQLNNDGYDLVSGSEENKLLHDWYQQAALITGPAFNWGRDTCTYPTYFQRIETFTPKVPAFKEKIRTKNKHFNELMKMAVDVDVEHAAMYYLLVPRSVHPKKEQYPAFYKSIVRAGKFKTAQLLQLGEAAEMMGRYSTFSYLMNPPKEKPVDMLAMSVGLFDNDTLKGYLIADRLHGYRSFEALENAVEPYLRYLVTDSMKASYFRALKAVSSFKKGSSAYNFSLEDIDGKKVSFSSMKGKVVLVDVWATWCQPCRVELPHLKALEESMKGKNVEFVSISVDVEKDKEKWKKMVEKDQLGGTQLYAAGWSEITKFYNINSIPRFLVFDQEGKIVTVDAPRPSTPELKQLLEETLK